MECQYVCNRFWNEISKPFTNWKPFWMLPPHRKMFFLALGLKWYFFSPPLAGSVAFSWNTRRQLCVNRMSSVLSESQMFWIGCMQRKEQRGMFTVYKQILSVRPRLHLLTVTRCWVKKRAQCNISADVVLGQNNGWVCLSQLIQMWFTQKLTSRKKLFLQASVKKDNKMYNSYSCVISLS